MVQISQSHIGDSIVFLYPPSRDSMIQVTAESYKSCNLKNLIFYMNNGNSLFNITSNGVFYFTSAKAGHCQKNQKLHVVVSDRNGNEVQSLKKKNRVTKLRRDEVSETHKRTRRKW
ncbi:hypothetical protein K1719_028023 [Acacia pycnantha]|nr:hypothetical protein K1719_028023 [Acacia pycnantha]